MRKYRLIWSDEFDKNGKPDPSKWTFDVGGHGGGNKEAQYYTESEKNCCVKDGKLIITAYKEKMENQEYTSGKIHTFGKFSFQYGRIEVSAKLPEGKGTWPAIWLLGDNIHSKTPWPLCGEIDVMEHVGRDPKNVIFSLHTKAYNHRLDNHRTALKKIDTVFDKFVVYAMDWTKDYIEFFADGVSVVRFTRGEREADSNPEGWPFDQPFYLLLNLAIGGTWGGEIDNSIFPVRYEIDYVRIYEITEG